MGKYSIDDDWQQEKCAYCLKKLDNRKTATVDNIEQDIHLRFCNKYCRSQWCYLQATLPIVGEEA